MGLIVAGSGIDKYCPFTYRTKTYLDEFGGAC